MTTNDKPPFKVVERREENPDRYTIPFYIYYDIVDSEGKVFIWSLTKIDEANLICTALNHYYEHSPEWVEELKVKNEQLEEQAGTEAMKWLTLQGEHDNLTAQNKAMAEALEKMLDLDAPEDFEENGVRWYYCPDCLLSSNQNSKLGKIEHKPDCSVALATTALNKITNDKTE